MKKWELIKSEMALDERWYKVRKDTVKLPNGKVMDDYFVGLRGKYVGMVGVFENGDLLMVRQYKHGAGTITLETPAGMVNEGEDPDECARREFEEETGYVGKKWTKLGVFHENPSKSVNETHFYLVTDLEKADAQHLDESEEIEVVRVPLKEFFSQFGSGELFVIPTIASVFMALFKLGYLTEK